MKPEEITHTHQWIPGGTYTHTHKRGNIPHGHHGSRYVTHETMASSGVLHPESDFEAKDQKASPGRGTIACLICGRRTSANCMLVIKNLSCHWCNKALDIADQIQDLFDETEIRKQERIKIIEFLKQCKHCWKNEDEKERVILALEDN